jgi:DNA-binding NarL/FixJ family response regulator
VAGVRLPGYLLRLRSDAAAPKISRAEVGPPAPRLPDDLLSAIRAVAAGDAVVAPSVTRRLLDALADQLPDPRGDAGGSGGGVLDPLTDREREVLLRVAEGLSNAEIGAVLSVSEATVKTHVGRVLNKLGLRDRVQAVVFAYQHGLVHPSK